MDIQSEEEEAKNPAEHASLDIAALVNSMKQRLPRLEASGPSHQQCTIYKVPKLLRQTDVKSYEPEVISIGPYHHGKKRLKSMEGQKLKHQQALLSRNPNIGLRHYRKKIKELEAQAQSCYSESIKHIKRSEFLEMMLLDGCFLVELFMRYILDEIDPKHQVWSQHFICHDMLLLENQIPYFILECIFGIVAPGEKLSLLVGHCFDEVNMPRNDDAHAKEHYHHLLDLFHHHCLPNPPDPLLPNPPEKKPENSDASRKSMLVKLKNQILSFNSYFQQCAGKQKQPRELQLSIPSAEELQEAGVKFKIKKKSCSFLDIKFNKSTGVMKIPYFFLGDDVDSVFRNLIAFEQCHPDARDCFTGYASFMDDFVNADKDIKILHRKGILEHGLGSHEKVARFFDSITKGVFFYKDTFLVNQFNDLNEYCNTRIHIWRANLLQNYFSSPWSILSLVAALVLLLLTFVQTFFTVFQYFRPP